MSAVNFAEVMGRMIQLGMESQEALQAAAFVTRNVVAFDHHHARIAAQLLPHTRELGLGIGDRACLALAMDRKLPVLTADKAWQRLRIGIAIRVIR
jgi:PIN domain nuclease of toxin-antitoxin system